MVLKSRFRRTRSIRLQKRFLIYNKGSRFYSYIDTRERWKKYIGRLCFQMQTPTLNGRAELSLLEKEFGETVSDFLLYDTHDYKSTHWIGVVALKSGPCYFTKIYKREEQAADNFARSQSAMQIFTPHFVLSESFYFEGRVCAYSLLQKQRNVSIKEVEAKVLERYEAEREQLRRLTREVDWFSPTDRQLLHEVGIALDPALVKKAGRAQMWSHGDLSHWNCFYDRSGRLCLIDYEEVGLYPPLYDWFHVILKPSLLKPGCLFPAEEIFRVSKRLHLEEEQVIAWLWLYLLMEMHKDLVRNRVLQSKKIDREVEYKRVLWRQCQNRLRD